MREATEAVRELAPALIESIAEDSDGSSVGALAALLTKLLTSGGRAEYQEGALPADNWLAKEAEAAESLSALTKSEGTAVARTEKTESSLVGNSILSVASSAVRDELNRCKAPSNGKNGVIGSLQLGDEVFVLSHSSSHKGSCEEGPELHLDGRDEHTAVRDDGM